MRSEVGRDKASRRTTNKNYYDPPDNFNWNQQETLQNNKATKTEKGFIKKYIFYWIIVRHLFLIS